MIALEQNTPNPSRAGSVIRFVLYAQAQTTLGVYDLQGRQVASILTRVPLIAGEHEVSVPTRGWPSGCYLYRLEAGGAVQTRKMFVVR